MSAPLPYPPEYHWNGWAWTLDEPTPAPLPTRVAPPSPVGVIASGPNHAIHAVLTLFTFWMCGGWAWVWLMVAANNHKTIQTIDAYGRVINAPLTPEQAAADAANRKGWMWGIMIGISILAIMFIIVVAVTPR